MRRSIAVGIGFFNRREGLGGATGTVLLVRRTAFSSGSCAVALRRLVGEVDFFMTVFRFDGMRSSTCPLTRISGKARSAQR